MMNLLIFIAWIASTLLGAGIALLIIRRIKNRPPKQEPIESNILVDPAKVGEIMHRWNTWEDMLEALKGMVHLVEYWHRYLEEEKGYEWVKEPAEKTKALEAIKKAESR